jgi:hypothetical protein
LVIDTHDIFYELSNLESIPNDAQHKAKKGSLSSTVKDLTFTVQVSVVILVLRVTPVSFDTF